jgi:RNA polymerase sigma-70 factor (ECF subfamily)
MHTIDTAVLDREDMQRLAAGQEAALNGLMERHAGALVHFLFRMLLNEDDANDLAQETFVRVYRHRDRYDGGKFTTWLYTIAANLARNEYRRRTRHPNISLEAQSESSEGTLADVLPSAEPGPSQNAASNELGQAVRAAVQRLPEELRDAVVLCEWEELSAEEAAAVLRTTSRAIESRLYRARKLLRDALAPWV